MIEALRRWLCGPLVKELNDLKKEHVQYRIALGECYMTLDRIALRDDAPSIELSRMAQNLIEKHGLHLTRKGMENVANQ